MNNYRDMYLKRMDRMGTTNKDRAMKAKEREFNNYFENALNKEYCLIDGNPSEVIFQDHSQSNNKDLSDDKYIVAPNYTDVKVGSYIDWRDSQLLVFTEEIKTIPTHQQLKAKIVNWTLKWVNSDGKIATTGAYVQNQTLYTLGIATSGHYISVVDGKMMMYVQNNEATRKGLKVGARIFVGLSVYKITFADIVSRKGLINLLMMEDTFNESTDNRELEVADYYNRIIEEDAEVILPTAEIIGESRVRLGLTYTYKISEGEVTEWIVESIDGNDAPFYIQERNGSEINLRIKDDYRYVNKTITVIAFLSDGQTVSLPLKTINKFS